MTLGHIYSALAYDWDHQEEVDAAIAAGGQVLEQLKRQTWSTRLGELLLQYGRI